MRRTDPAAPRVALLGQFGIGNFGNEASLAAVLRLLDGHADVVVVTEAPAPTAAAHGVTAVPFLDEAALRGGMRGLWGKVRDLRWAWAQVRGVDAVVVPGTGILEGQSVHSSAIPLTLLWYALSARLLRVPFVLLCVGADGQGPRLARTFFGWTLRWASCVSVRDAGSSMAVTALSGRVPAVVADLVLGEPCAPVERGRRVALGVIDTNGTGTVEASWSREAYVARCVVLAGELASAGVEVTVVGGAGLDDAIADEIVLACAEPALVTRGDAVDLSSLDRELGTCSVVVASRYHNLVAALRAGTPVVSLGYGPKHRWLLEAFGQGALAHDVETFDPRAVAAQIAGLLADPWTARSQIERGLAVARERLETQERALLTMLGLPAPDAVANPREPAAAEAPAQTVEAPA